MTNYLAIATVTAALQRMLQAVVQVDVEGARVTTLRPNSIGNGTPEKGVNLYLYQVTLNPAWRNNNVDMRSRNRKGEMGKRSRTALDLHYMISVYGNEAELEPQRLLGSVMRTLHDYTTLTADMIQDTIADSNYTYLSHSYLTEQAEEINFFPLELSLEDLSKIWSVFFQTPYALSVAYRATVVMIEGKEPGKKALPVRTRRVGIGSYLAQPIIDEVISQAGKFEPILADSVLLIRGRNLNSDTPLVRIGEIEITAQASDTEIILPLSSLPTDSLRAGVQSLQVIHPFSSRTESITNNGSRTSNGRSTITLRTPSTSVQGIESNVAPFVLRPTITNTSISHLEGSDDEPRDADLTVQVNLTVGKRQRVVLALNEWTTDNPAAYLFDASRRRGNTNSLRIPVRNVKPGEYLVRLHIDGAESQLGIDTDAASSTFNWYISPRVTIA
jgi:hypothetical protein